MENTQYRHFGVMLDCSRNAVMKPSEVKKFIDVIVKMGYNTLELYTEDTFEVKEIPHFGYFRGRYTGEELKEIDAYAKSKGVELIPCIQTLAHFSALTRWTNVYGSFFDYGDILLVDDEKTYEFIENLFKSLAENFSSRLVNIGMDEAHMVGLGKYLDKHGYQNRFDILLKHLNRVVEIAKKYGFKPHMWSDMFFRLANGGKYIDDSPALSIPQEVCNKVPEEVELAYWDYYSTDENTYDQMLRAHEEFGKNIWFAGGAWTWDGFAPLNGFSLKTMQLAMKQVKKHGVKDVLITMWGDNGAECSAYGVLPSLYAIRQYADGNFDETEIEKGFKELFGFDYSDFMLLDLPNRTTNNIEGLHAWGQCKKMLYNDPFLGLSDSFVEREGYTPYGEYETKLMQASARVGEYAYVFRTLGKLCALLSLKKDLGLNTRKAYQEKDKKALKAIVKDYKNAVRKLDEFYQEFKALWMKENKPFGWEIQDIRLGGLKTRLLYCEEKLTNYLKGKIEKIEELEEEILEKEVPGSWYATTATPSLL